MLRWVAILSPGDLSDPGIKPSSILSPALAGRFFTTVPWKIEKIRCPIGASKGEVSTGHCSPRDCQDSTHTPVTHPSYQKVYWGESEPRSISVPPRGFLDEVTGAQSKWACVES